MYRKLYLGSRKYPGMYAWVDQRFYDELNQHSWHVKPKSNTFYVMRHEYVDGKRTTTRLHREIAKLNGWDIEGFDIDHKDFDGLNNSLSNLRIATSTENGQGRRRGGSSRFIGVHWDKKSNKWRSAFTINSRVIYLGLYDDEIDAAKAYDKAVIANYGPDCKRNFYDFERRICEANEVGFGYKRPLNEAGLEQVLRELTQVISLTRC